MIGKKWSGFQPPAMGKVKKLAGKTGDSPIGAYKIGRKSKSKKLRQVFG